MTNTELQSGIFYESLSSMPLAMNHHPYILMEDRPAYIDMPTPIGYRKTDLRMPKDMEPFLGTDGDVWIATKEALIGEPPFKRFILTYTRDEVLDKTVSRVRPSGIIGGAGLHVMSWVDITTGKILCHNSICTNRHPHIETVSPSVRKSWLSIICGR